MSTNEIGFHPGARLTDHETSHEAFDRDHRRTQYQILHDVKANGPATEETILNRLGIERSSASSQISALVKSGHLVDLIDTRTTKVITLRNTSGCRARVRGLPKHQHDRTIIETLLIQMDNEKDGNSKARKPALSSAGAEKAASYPSGERRHGERRKADRRKFTHTR
jgi:DNA-binding MarR family transcriptional regulator